MGREPVGLQIVRTFTYKDCNQGENSCPTLVPFVTTVFGEVKETLLHLTTLVRLGLPWNSSCATMELFLNQCSILQSVVDADLPDSVNYVLDRSWFNGSPLQILEEESTSSRMMFVTLAKFECSGPVDGWMTHMSYTMTLEEFELLDDAVVPQVDDDMIGILHVFKWWSDACGKLVQVMATFERTGSVARRLVQSNGLPHSE
ncbi:hypothetical protein B0H19DRAFT_1065622 [Mycena capillaripes]|nr:hypothetical protein B0H19DRAFT_1065622 [Mycena capillaripes]